MNYSYLFVDNLNGHSYENGLNELKTSIATLKKFQTYDSIRVFNNETSGKNIEYFKEENIIHNHINLSRNYGGSDSINPISILVEKIISLKNYDENDDIVLMDIDTTLKSPIPENFWDNNSVVFDNAEYYIMQWRNLDKVLPQIPWKQFDINFDSSFIMYNTGVIYIPKRFRKELCEKALKIVDYLNENFEPEERNGNKLDEQIALSIVCHDCFGKYGHIKLSNNYIDHHWEERQRGINWWENEQYVYQNSTKQTLKTLPISVGILSWKSNQTLRNTLDSYKRNGFFDIVDDVTLFFQEVSENDIKIAKEYNIPFMAFSENIGIGKAFSLLTNNCKNENILLLEHDWELLEDKETTFDRLNSGIEMLNLGYDSIRYRHRISPGFPLFGLAHKGDEIKHFDSSIDLEGAHLFDCIHWTKNPEVEFSDKISKHNSYYITTSRWSNFTNNPCLYKKDFYMNAIEPFKDKGSLYDGLESNISYWWARQNFNIAWGEGLFKHNDIQKYGDTCLESLLS